MSVALPPCDCLSISRSLLSLSLALSLSVPSSCSFFLFAALPDTRKTIFFFENSSSWYQEDQRKKQTLPYNPDRWTDVWSVICHLPGGVPQKGANKANKDFFQNFYLKFRVLKLRFLVFSECLGGFRELPEAGRNHFHLSW